MLYVDMALPIKLVNPNADYYKNAVVVGRRNGRDFYLPVPPTLEGKLEAGFHLDLSLEGTTSARGPRIVAKLDDRLYLILSSRFTHDTDFVGNIRVPRPQPTRIITRVKPFLGTGKWETLIIEAKAGESYYVNWNRLNGTDAVNCFYYIVALDQVITCQQMDIPGLLSDLKITPAFTVRNDLDLRVSRLDYREWRKL